MSEIMNNYNDYFFLFLLPILATGQQLSCKVLIFQSELIRNKEKIASFNATFDLIGSNFLVGPHMTPWKVFSSNLMNLI